MDIADIVLPHACYDVDLYIVGLQEMVDLSMIGAVTCKKDVQRVLQWEEKFLIALNKRIGNFVCVQRKVMFGCLTLIFAKASHIDLIGKV